MIPDRPLSAREIDELDAFLACEAAPEKCMDVSTLHGFLTAVGIGPGMVLPSEWLPIVWGDAEGPEFKSLREAKRISSLIMRLYNSILRTLREDLEKFEPLLLEGETEEGNWETVAEAWCEGFAEGMSLRKREWEPLLRDKVGGMLLTPILAFVDDRAMEKMLASAQDPKVAREGLVAMIRVAVAGLYNYWLERRKPPGKGLAPDAARFIPRPRVSRNDPCPCGSGKKYKKCCALRPN